MPVIIEYREAHVPSLDANRNYVDGVEKYVSDYLFYRTLFVQNGLSDRELMTFVMDTGYLQIQRHIGRDPDGTLLQALEETMCDIDYFIPLGFFKSMPPILINYPFLWKDQEITYATYENATDPKDVENEASEQLIVNFWEEGEFYTPSTQSNRYLHIGNHHASRPIN